MKKVILVTGASSGIGKAAAERLIKDGHTVYVAARRIQLMDDLKALGALPLAMDITSESEVQAVMQTIASAHNGLDVLINNAGFAIYGAVEDVSIEEAKRQFDVNIFGLARITQLALPYMRERRSGTIINISSMGGKIYTPLGAWYHATKHALEGWSDCLRLELAPFGIKVVIIEPGIIKTGFDDVMLAPMLEKSGSGAYATMAKKVAEGTEKAYSRQSAGPEIIARTISKAVASNHPKTRYAAGPMAKISISTRKWLSDKMFDKMIMQMGYS